MDDEEKPSDAIGAELLAWLKPRRPEIEDAIVARILDSEIGAAVDEKGLAELRPAMAGAVSMLVAAIEEEEDWVPTLPPAVVEPIQLAARYGAPMEGILRGFSIVSTGFMEFLAEGFTDRERAQEVLRHGVRLQTMNNDRLMAAFAAVYEEEMERLRRTAAHDLALRVRGLLDGDPAESADLGYDLDAWHTGLVAIGAKADVACQGLAQRLGCEVLSMPGAGGKVWAWLGSTRRIAFDRLSRAAASALAESVSLAVGEPRKGIEGWRLTHREAELALAVVLRTPGQRVTRCSDVVLPAAVMGDETLERVLVDAFLKPLREHRNGSALSQTLRTYLGVNGNIASTAASLGVDRHTVRRRLRKIEEAIDRPLDECRAQLEVALHIEPLS
jgi:PucR C-terminal helix-turn-helix domain/GGDEF-like domain